MHLAVHLATNFIKNFFHYVTCQIAYFYNFLDRLSHNYVMTVNTIDHYQVLVRD
jgi:hypothetical protein